MVRVIETQEKVVQMGGRERIGSNEEGSKKKTETVKRSANEGALRKRVEERR